MHHMCGAKAGREQILIKIVLTGCLINLDLDMSSIYDCLSGRCLIIANFDQKSAYHIKGINK